MTTTNDTGAPREEKTSHDPLVEKLDAAGFFDPAPDKITAEHALALVPAPSWADRAEYERHVDDQDEGYWIVERAEISSTDVANVGMERMTAVTGSGVVVHTIESIRVGHADEEFWIETRNLAAVLDEIRGVAVTLGVAQDLSADLARATACRLDDLADEWDRHKPLRRLCALDDDLRRLDDPVHPHTL